MRAVIFDLDGTLADTSADLIAAANAVLPGAPLDPVADRGTAFRGARAMLRLGLERRGGVDETEVDRLYGRLLDAYEAGIDRETRLYPGALDAAAALRARGVALGIATNKPYGLADLLLRRLGVREAFGPLIGADTLPVRKPDPAHLWAAVDAAGGERERTLLVGDTETDMRTARAAGVPIVLVAFGPEGDGIARLEPDAMLPDYAGLGVVVDRLLP